MTGQELFYALSFVDERYIAEADTARLKAGIPWKKVLSVAACLCILIAGAYSLNRMGLTHKTAAPEAAAPPQATATMESVQEMPEAAPPMIEDSLAEPALDPDEIYGPTVEVSVRIDGQSYLLETKDGMDLLNLLKDQAYDVNQICRCTVEFTVVTEFGVEYHINLKEGFARCEQGQAFLSNEDMQNIQAILEELPGSLPAELHHVAFAKVRVVKVLEDGSFEAIIEADEPMEMDTQVRVVFDPSMVPGAGDTSMETFSVSEGAEFNIEDGAYDPEQNILYIANILLIDE